jgi:hypothetical protein
MARVVTATELRKDVYRLLDEVIATGEPLRIERDGHVLHIVASSPPAGGDLWSRPPGFHPCVAAGVSLDDLVHAPTSEWDPTDLLAHDPSEP